MGPCTVRETNVFRRRRDPIEGPPGKPPVRHTENIPRGLRGFVAEKREPLKRSVKIIPAWIILKNYRNSALLKFKVQTKVQATVNNILDNWPFDKDGKMFKLQSMIFSTFTHQVFFYIFYEVVVTKIIRTLIFLSEFKLLYLCSCVHKYMFSEEIPRWKETYNYTRSPSEVLVIA